MTGCDDSYCTCDEHSHRECDYCYRRNSCSTKKRNDCKKVVKVGKYGRDGKDGKDGKDGTSFNIADLTKDDLVALKKKLASV